ncbi:MAG: hypothetical protein QMD25_02990 [Caldisericia bacterium]|jgi:flagellar biosynthesis/type III secretory pathway M-ring protein FliF/YscJ|nr:hypothetical protein [Caldisericia bacterium]
MAKKEKEVNKTRKITPKKTEEQKKRERLLLVLFIILIIIAAFLFYFLYLKPPSQPIPTETQGNILNQVLKNLDIGQVKDEIEKRSLTIPSLETKPEEIGKENPFLP